MRFIYILAVEFGNPSRAAVAFTSCLRGTGVIGEGPGYGTNFDGPYLFPLRPQGYEGVTNRLPSQWGLGQLVAQL
jgi:hypothetical protein